MPSITSRRAFPRAIPARGKVGPGVAAAAAAAGLFAAAAPASAAPVEPPTLLAQGSAGAAVAEVQQALRIAATGRYDRLTKDAVISFQRRDALMVDGVVGPQTWDALFGIHPQPAPAPAPAPSSATTATTTTTAPSTPSSYAPASTGSYSGSGGYSVPSSIVACESGGNYSAVNPSSGAGGAYQILPSTWRSYGGQGLPQDAPAAEQNAIAGKIYAAQGASAWSC